MADSMRYDWRRMVVRDPHLTEAARRVLLELESWADPDGTNARPGRELMVKNLRTPRGHINEKTVRRALEDGVERGFIERTVKGHGGRGGNVASVYALTFPRASVDAQISTDSSRSVDSQMPSEPSENGGHSDVHRTRLVGGHLEDVSGHIEQFGGHPDVHLPVPFTSSSTPDISSHLRNAGAGEQNQSIPKADTTPTYAPDPIANPIAWIDNELPGGFRIGERERAKQMLDDGTAYGSIRFSLLRERREGAGQLRSVRRRKVQSGPQYRASAG